jgi:hypothetical protein
MDDISSCNVKSVEVSSVDREVEGSEFKAVVDRISSNFKTARAI